MSILFERRVFGRAAAESEMRLESRGPAPGGAPGLFRFWSRFDRWLLSTDDHVAPSILLVAGLVVLLTEGAILAV